MSMRATVLALPVALLTLGSPTATLPKATPTQQAARTIALTNGRWYTGTGFTRRTLYIDNGVFRSARPARVDTTIDLKGGYLIPPFGDAHTHNLDGKFNLDKVRDAYVAEGTFYVNVLTNSTTGADEVRARFNQPCDLDVVYANGGLTSTLSHPFLAYEPRAMRLFGDWSAHAAEIRKSRLREGNAYWFIDSLPDLTAEWPKILATRPGIIKIFLLDARENPPPMSDSGLPSGHGLRPSLVPEIVRRAHAAGLRVAAHVETAADFEVAVDGGVDLMAHLPGYEMGSDLSGQSHANVPSAPYEISEALAAKAGQRGLLVVPTVAWTYTGGGRDSAAAVIARQDLMRRNIARLRAHGAHMVVGSDWFGRTAWREVELMRALGAWRDAELLSMWAVETPQAIFPGRKIGKLEDGYEASFLVLDANPLEGFDAVQHIRMRVKQGCMLAS